MDYAVEVKQLRDNMGMTRTEFCSYFDIPYRTVCDCKYKELNKCQKTCSG